MARHRAIGNGSFPFAPRVQTARAGTDAGSEYLGEVPAAKTLRFLVGVRGNFALRLTRLHMEAVLEGAFLDDAVSSSLSMLIRAAISEMTTGPIKIPIPKCLKPAGKANSNSRGCSSTQLPITSGRMTLSAVPTTRAPHRIKKTPFQR